MRKAIEYFGRALRLNPAYAPAHSGLGACWVFSSLLCGKRPGESFPQAKACAARALEIDSHLSEAHATLGMVHAWYEFDWSNGERELKRAIELEPGNVTAHTWYAFLLGSLRRHEEASTEIRTAVRLDPLSWAVRAVYAFLQEWVGQGRSAIEELEKALEMNPGYYFARMQLGYYCLSVLGCAHDAISHLRRACEDSGRQPDALSSLGCVYAALGMRREAFEILDELNGTRQYASPFFFARIHVFLGDYDRAFALLDQAFEERFFWLMMMQNDPAMRPLAGDPRYNDLARRMAFPETRAAAPETPRQVPR